MAWRGGWGKKDMGYKCADSAVEFDSLKLDVNDFIIPLKILISIINHNFFYELKKFYNCFIYQIHKAQRL